MITESKLKHSLGVARSCYSQARESGGSVAFSKRMFLLGLVHDIGYEFVGKEEHAEEGAAILTECSFSEEDIDAVRKHGMPLPLEEQSLQLRILNKADLQVSSTGRYVTPKQRLQEIGDRYGRNSLEYKNADMLCKELKII